MDSSKDDPRARQLSTGKKKFNIDPDKVSRMFVFGCIWLYGYRLWPLRRPNTVFAHALANTIQQAHKDYKNKHAIDTVIILFVQCLVYLYHFSS